MSMFLFLQLIGFLNLASTDGRIIFWWGTDVYRPSDNRIFRFSIILVFYILLCMPSYKNKASFYQLFITFQYQKHLKLHVPSTGIFYNIHTCKFTCIIYLSCNSLHSMVFHHVLVWASNRRQTGQLRRFMFSEQCVSIRVVCILLWLLHPRAITSWGGRLGPEGDDRSTGEGESRYCR